MDQLQTELVEKLKSLEKRVNKLEEINDVIISVILANIAKIMPYPENAHLEKRIKGLTEIMKSVDTIVVDEQG